MTLKAPLRALFCCSDILLPAVLYTTETGVCDTLDEVSLAEEVEYDKGSYNKHTGRIHYDSRKGSLCRIVTDKNFFTDSLKRFRHCGPECVACKKNFVGVGKEDICIENICPLPREGKNEDSDEHRNGARENDAEECFENTVTVNIRSFFKFVGNTAIELSHKVDKQTVLKCKTCDGKEKERDVCTVNT